MKNRITQLARRRQAGFTLIEILLATIILSLGIMVLMTSMGNCAKMMMISKEYQDIQYVFDLGELKYPLLPTNDPENDLPVDPDSDLVEGYTFQRTVDEKDLDSNQVDDDLYLVRTRVTWGPGDEDYEELVRYVRKDSNASGTKSGNASSSASTSSKSTKN